MARAIALYACVGDDEAELSFNPEDVIVDVEPAEDEGWYRGRLAATGAVGLFPGNYVQFEDAPVEAKPAVPGRPAFAARPTVGAGPGHPQITKSASSSTIGSMGGVGGGVDFRSQLRPIPSGSVAPDEGFKLDKKPTINKYDARKALLEKSSILVQQAKEDALTKRTRQTSAMPALGGGGNVANPNEPIGPGNFKRSFSASAAMTISSMADNTPETSNTPAVPKRPPMLQSNQSYQPPATPSRGPSFSEPSNAPSQTQPAAAVPAIAPKKPAPPVPRNKPAIPGNKPAIPANKPSVVPGPQTQQQPASWAKPDAPASQPRSTSPFGSAKSATSDDAPPRLLKPSEIRAQQQQQPSSADELPSRPVKPSEIRAQQPFSKIPSSNEFPAEPSRPLKPSELKAQKSSPFGVTASVTTGHASNGLVKPSQLNRSFSSGSAASVSSDVHSIPSRPSTNQGPTMPKRPDDVAVPSVPRRPTMPSRPSATNVNEEPAVPARPPQHGEWANRKITPDARVRYEELFNESDTDGDGYLSGDDVRSIWVRSGLDTDSLAKIWILSDTDDDGFLTCPEFVVGMYLIDDRLRGYPIPDTLPPGLL